MKNKNEILERIDKPYISSTCVQISESYRNSLTIFNRNGIIYHDVVNFPCTPINKYIKDNIYAETGILHDKPIRDISSCFNTPAN